MEIKKMNERKLEVICQPFSYALCRNDWKDAKFKIESDKIGVGEANNVW